MLVLKQLWKRLVAWWSANSAGNVVSLFDAQSAEQKASSPAKEEVVELPVVSSAVAESKAPTVAVVDAAKLEQSKAKPQLSPKPSVAAPAGDKPAPVKPSTQVSRPAPQKAGKPVLDPSEPIIELEAHEVEPIVAKKPEPTLVAEKPLQPKPIVKTEPVVADKSPRARGKATPQDSAKRLARALISDMKLYNEAKVAAGRMDGNLYDLLQDDIERSRQHYNDRVGEDAASLPDYFYQELISNLCNGDPTLLGPNYNHP